MSLKTQENLQDLLQTMYQMSTLSPVYRNYLPQNITSDRMRLLHQETSRTIFDTSRHSLISPFPFMLSNMYKYTKATGKTQREIQIDFLFHWISNWIYLSTRETIHKAAIAKETACSLSTVIALNKYLDGLPASIKKKELSFILKGSPYRWKTTDLGEYVPVTFYPLRPNGEVATLDAYAFNALFRTQVHSFTSLPTFLSHLSTFHASCVPQERTLLQHSSKATEKFQFKYEPKVKNTKLPLFLGVELELEGFSSKEFKTLDILKDHAIFKRDGSLTQGVEICTAPATIDVHKKEFENFFNKVKENKSKLNAASTCGLHIHIDKKSLSQLHIANLYKLINNQKEDISLTKIAGRSPNRYCEKHEVDYFYFTQDKSTSKYRQVNLSPTNTIELRLFASTTDFPVFASRLELAQAVVDYTRPGEVAIPTYQIPLWSNFVSYVNSHKKFYPFLSKEI